MKKKFNDKGKQEEAGELVNHLRSTLDMEEQGDILHYMVMQFGLPFKVVVSKINRLVR